MAFVPQTANVFTSLTVEENLEAIMQIMPYSRRERSKRKEELLEEFGLTRLVHNQAAVLSGGEKRRLEIARSLITNPRLLLLDEPFSGVDPIAVNEIQNIIYRLRDKGIGILVTDHNVRETLSTTKKSYIIYEGKILASGSCEEILNNKDARKYYLGEKFTM
jgi:lipopolysaccharide export system ATP-binding protein